MSNCVCEPYIKGADAETITQGADFDLAEGVKAYDGYGEEIEFGYQPNELDTCEVGEHTVRYTAYGKGNRLVPQLCIPRGKSSLPSVCANDLERVTEDRVITILQADPPFFKGRGFDKNRLDPNTASDYEYGGLTWAFNEESGTVTVSGTYEKTDPEASDDGTFTVSFMQEIEDGDYILTGCPSGGSEDTYYIEWLYLDSNEEIHTGIETGEGVTLNGIASGLVVTIYVKQGVTVNNLTFKPMLRLASVEDDTYEPYSGDSAMYVAPNTDFDPTDGVTATDANGNSVEYTYDGLYAEEASGDIASFETNVSAPLLSLVADIDPIQDLHGYDKPWAGGAGKNKLDDDGIEATTKALSVARNSGHGSPFLMKANTTYTVSCNNSTKASGVYLYVPYTSTIINAKYNATSLTYTPTEDTEVAVEFYWANGRPSGATHIQVEEGSTATSYSPYSNICPISGHTEVVTQRTGKNLADNSQFSIEQPSWYTGQYWLGLTDNGDGTYTETRPIGWGGYGFVYVGTFKSGTYFVSAELKDLASVTCAMNYMFKRKGTWDTVESYTNSSISSLGRYGASKTINEECDLWIVCAPYTSNGANVKFGNIQVEVGTVMTAYEPYNGHTYTTSLGRTVYGGTLDVVSGELVVDRAMVDAGTLAWYYINNMFMAKLDGADATNAYLYNIISSRYATTTAPNYVAMNDKELLGVRGIQTTGVVSACIKDSAYTDTNDFKASMNGSQIVYELATPQTYQLDPTEVDLLLGQNNVWADSGEVEVVYQMQIPQGEDYQYPLEGNYQLIYTAEDKCGNIGRGTRNIIVADETFRTVVYDDGTLIINESSYDTASNLVKHGAVKAVYDPMLEDGSNYVFNQNTPWTQNWTISNSITRVEIGSVIRPTSTASWFFNLRMAEEFNLSKLDTSRVTDMNYMFGYVSYSLSSGSDVYLDLSNFDTSNVTNMSRMFDHVERLIEVDVSGFDTSNVNYLTRMFGYCNNLETIYASGAFSTRQLWDSTEMFIDDYKLVGGNGTAYNSSHMNYEYARLDNPPAEPGYFTAKE